MFEFPPFWRRQPFRAARLSTSPATDVSRGCGVRSRPVAWLTPFMERPTRLPATLIT